MLTKLTLILLTSITISVTCIPVGATGLAAGTVMSVGGKGPSRPPRLIGCKKGFEAYINHTNSAKSCNECQDGWSSPGGMFIEDQYGLYPSCSQCIAGTSSGIEPSGACSTCQIGYISTLGSLNCTACGTNQTSSLNNTICISTNGTDLTSSSLVSDTGKVSKVSNKGVKGSKSATSVMKKIKSFFKGQKSSNGKVSLLKCVKGVASPGCKSS